MAAPQQQGQNGFLSSGTLDFLFYCFFCFCAVRVKTAAALLSSCFVPLSLMDRRQSSRNTFWSDLSISDMTGDPTKQFPPGNVSDLS